MGYDFAENLVNGHDFKVLSDGEIVKKDEIETMLKSSRIGYYQFYLKLVKKMITIKPSQKHTLYHINKLLLQSLQWYKAPAPKKKEESSIPILNNLRKNMGELFNN